jgi:hypothetical protein
MATISGNIFLGAVVIEQPPRKYIFKDGCSKVTIHENHILKDKSHNETALRMIFLGTVKCLTLQKPYLYRRWRSVFFYEPPLKIIFECVQKLFWP